MNTRRLIDIAGASAGLLLISPLLLAIALLVVLTMGRPVFFRQERIGRFGAPFNMLKFRTMRENTMQQDLHTEVRHGHPLVTPLGAFLRRYKLDELPQLVHVVTGEMSFIGPRPTVRKQVEQYSAFQRRRLAVAPGLTGWSQVNGGIELTWSERIMLDVWYVYHRSAWLDLRILSRTVGTICFGERISRKALSRARMYARASAPTEELDFQDAKAEAVHAI